MSFLKRGDAAQQAAEAQEAQHAARKAQFDKPHRFFLNEGENAEITFVDGYLDDAGRLDAPMLREHHLFMNGRWGNFFVCTSDYEPCPICEGGDNPSLVAVFTIIDHRVIQGKKQVYQDERKLFVCGNATYKKLQQYAASRGGIAGWRVSVTRADKNAARVGDTFDFLNLYDHQQLAQFYVDDKGHTKFAPIDYEKEFTFVPAAELRKLGFGGATATSQYAQPGGAPAAPKPLGAKPAAPAPVAAKPMAPQPAAAKPVAPKPAAMAPKPAAPVAAKPMPPKPAAPAPAKPMPPKPGAPAPAAAAPKPGVATPPKPGLSAANAAKHL